MTPLTRQLTAWRRREAAGLLAWAVARWVAVVAAGLVVACLIDLFIDRRRDTPFAVRLLLSGGQLAAAVVAAVWLWRRTRVPTLDALAGRAELAVPAFGHRLVTALQLTRPGARTESMSPALIAVVAREAEQLADAHPLRGLADRRSWTHALYALAPVAAVAAVALLVAPATSTALLARQLLLPVDIPRSVQLADDTAPLWAAGDPVTVRLIASGDVDSLVGGTLRVEPDDQPAETFPLGFAETLPDGRAVFVATLPPMSTPFQFSGRVGDGRLRSPGRVTFEPRPAVQSLTATTVSPPWLDPAGKREYRREQQQGEVQALPFHEVEVKVAFTKTVKSATVAVFARDDAGREVEVARVAFRFLKDEQYGTVRFLPPPRATGYRVFATDSYGFGLAAPPRRGLTVAPDTPPAVTLLPETLKDPKEDGPAEDFDVTGMPLRPGGQVQVGYAARSPLGLGRAVAVYSVNAGPWTPLPLADTVADPAVVGPFVRDLGVFRESGPFGQVEFYRLPSPDPDQQPDALEAGGRINFQTAALTKAVVADGKRTTAKLEVGDTVEIRLAVYDRHPGPHASATRPPDPPRRAANGGSPAPADPRRPAGWSVSVFKQVVSDAEFEAWRKQHEAFRSRLGQVEEKQRQVFPRPE